MAKDARPHVSGRTTDWTKWQRARPAVLTAALADAPAHPWQALVKLERLPRAVRMRLAANTSCCHKPRWKAGKWVCDRCGCLLKSGRELAAASTTICPAIFGSGIHASHALSIGIARMHDWDEGLPLAVCRGFGSYSAHTAAGLKKVCGGYSAGRRSQLRRFERGLHPDARVKLRVDGVRHHPAGWRLSEQAAVGQKSGGERPEGVPDDESAGARSTGVREPLADERPPVQNGLDDSDEEWDGDADGDAEAAGFPEGAFQEPPDDNEAFQTLPDIGCFEEGLGMHTDDTDGGDGGPENGCGGSGALRGPCADGAASPAAQPPRKKRRSRSTEAGAPRRSPAAL